MLKKLVKYGNSNALILDKAILELLEIEEGSTLKIKTDGTSIIITPQIKKPSEQVQEHFTHDQANIDAATQEMVKQFENLSKNEQESLKKKYQDLIKKHQEISLKLRKNSAFMEEVKNIADRNNTFSPAYVTAYKELKNTFAPELVCIEKEIADTAKQQPAIKDAFLAAHKNNETVLKAYGELLNNPAYQHQAQLIAEQYNADKQSTEYLQAMNALNNTYLPEYQYYQEELLTIAKRYSADKN